MELQDLILDVEQQITIGAGVETVYEGVLRRLTEQSRTPMGPMPLRLEQWPGGRWFRDLGESGGHLWGHVQVIKPPTLIEISGPMFMSYPVAGHLAIRLTPEGTATTVALRHRAIGQIEEAHRAGVTSGWASFLDDVRQLCT